MLDELIYGIIIAFIVVLGLCFGSFLNVVIYRLPNNMNIAFPSSHCPNCNYKLKWYDNIPVLSYIILKGKCRNCKEKISPRYMIVEILTAILILVCYLKFDLSLMFILSSIAVMVYICITFIDSKHYIIPDSLNIILGIIGIFSLFCKMEKGNLIIDWQDKLIGLGVGILLTAIFILIEKVLKKEVIGGGDLKLILATSLFLGWQLMLLGIFLGSFIACLIEIPLSRNEKLRENHQLPFGPYLVGGFLISLFVGMNIIEWYLSILF